MSDPHDPWDGNPPSTAVEMLDDVCARLTDLGHRVNSSVEEALIGDILLALGRQRPYLDPVYARAGKIAPPPMVDATDVYTQLDDIADRLRTIGAGLRSAQ